MQTLHYSQSISTRPASWGKSAQFKSASWLIQLNKQHIIVCKSKKKHTAGVNAEHCCEKQLHIQDDSSQQKSLISKTLTKYNFVASASVDLCQKAISQHGYYCHQGVRSVNCLFLCFCICICFWPRDWLDTDIYLRTRAEQASFPGPTWELWCSL